MRGLLSQPLPLRWGIASKTVLLAISLVGVVLVTTAVPTFYLAAESLERQAGENALDIAQTLAISPAIREAFYSPDPAAVIAPLAEEARVNTGADFVVIRDRAGRYLSAPDPSQLGKATAALDYGPALMEGRHFYTPLEESEQPALAGVAPIHGRSGEVVGIVSVGFHLAQVTELIQAFSRRVAWIAALGLAVGVGGAILLARHLKRQMFGLEPVQIAELLEERTTVVQSIREGIVAIDAQSRITVVNDEARRILGLPSNPEGMPVAAVIPDSRLPQVLSTGEPLYDLEVPMGERVVVANYVPMRHGANLVGAVASFRDRTEFYRLTGELQAARRYSETLRAQTHEFTNRLHAVAGLIQLGATDEALEYILRVEGEHQQILDTLVQVLPDPLVGAIVLGKYHRAAERRVRMTIDPHGQFTQAPAQLGTDLLVTILGNLLDNAIEAVMDRPPEERWVHLQLDDRAEAISIAVMDGGAGVPPELREAIFADGFSTKPGERRGFGLALVRLLVQQAGGEIQVLDNPSRFVVTIPGG